MAVFSCYFRAFVGAQIMEDLIEYKSFLAEVFQMTSRFVLVKNKLGDRCTLRTDQRVVTVVMARNRKENGHNWKKWTKYSC